MLGIPRFVDYLIGKIDGQDPSEPTAVKKNNDKRRRAPSEDEIRARMNHMRGYWFGI